MTRLLVVGSYPPVPGPPAAATVAAVCRGWAEGREVEVVSPRPSAAHRSARLVGVHAAKELARLRRETQASELVLSIEPGMPFAPGRRPFRHGVEAIALALVLGGYARVTLLLAPDVELSAGPLTVLWPRVREVVTWSEDESQLLASRLGVPAALITVDREPRVLPVDSPGWTGLVTPAGPSEWDRSEGPRRIASLTAHKLLGHRTDAVRTRAVLLFRSVQRRVAEYR